MKVYRLSPLAADDPSSKYSVEKEHVRVGVATPAEVRELVAGKSGFRRLAEPGAISRWTNDRVTSCAEEPTLTHPGAGDVIREYGGHVADGSTPRWRVA